MLDPEKSVDETRVCSTMHQKRKEKKVNHRCPAEAGKQERADLESVWKNA